MLGKQGLALKQPLVSCAVPLAGLQLGPALHSGCANCYGSLLGQADTQSSVQQVSCTIHQHKHNVFIHQQIGVAGKQLCCC